MFLILKPPSDDPKAIEETFNQYIEEEKIGGEKTIYVVKEGENIIAYAFPIGGTGLWGGL